MTTVHHIDVFYSDPKNGWVAMEKSQDGSQTSDGVYSYLKSDAQREANAMSGGIYPIYIFGKDGVLQRTLNDQRIDL